MAGVLVSAVAGCFVACDDDESATDEWTADYVYLERLKLGIGSLEFNQTHSVSRNCRRYGGLDAVCGLILPNHGSRMSAVKFAYTIEGDMPEEIVTFREGGAVVIPAGELAARDTMDLRTDWSFVPQEAATYKVTVGIGSVQPVSGQLRISSKQKELSVQINKAKSMEYTGRRETFGRRIAGTAVGRFMLPMW